MSLITKNTSSKEAGSAEFMKEKLVVLTGAGISAESGLKTFRDSDGLWENYNVYDVATPEAWHRDQELVLKFYNERRKQVRAAQPNAAHKALVDLERKFDVTIITQNIDDLHERAGSGNVLHLHGEIIKSRSSLDENLLYDCPGDIELGQKCEKGSQLRPHVVWFGEMVPMIEVAGRICRQAEIFLVIGTSLAVYPAAGLVHYVDYDVPKYVIDPNIPQNFINPSVTTIQETAVNGVPKLVKQLLEQ